jgi:hypothetical protein
MDARPVDPRDARWQVDDPAYRVTFWTAPHRPDAWHAEEWELTGGDVTDALAWIEEHGAGRRFTIYTAQRAGNGELGIVRLAGIDPTRA